jgi:hypothetical protein
VGLNRELLARRLRDVDFRMMQAMQCETMHSSAHRSKDDARRGVNPITRSADAGNALAYRVTYSIKTLIERGVYSDPLRQPIIVLMDLNEHGNYPFTSPESYVIGSVTPWSPHFLPNVRICFEVPGHVWKSDGSTTLGHLAQHIARLINFDEKIRDPSYTGWNGEAIEYWRQHLNSSPITSNLTYPMIPDWYFDPTGAATPPRATVVTGSSKATVTSKPAPPTVRVVPRLPQQRHDD